MSPCKLVPLLIGSFLIWGPAPIEAKTAKSLDYELEYATVSAGSDQTGSADYAVVGALLTEGVAVNAASSSSYSTEPVIGSATGVTSSVGDWMLF